MANEIVENAPLSVFVTGATDALGREVVRRLHAAGHRVTGATSGYENAALVRADGGVPAYPDLMRAGELRSAILAAKADIVINLAPQRANHPPQVRPNWDVRLLDEGVSALLEAAEAAGVKYVVHTSYAYADAESDELEDLLHALESGESKVMESSIPGAVLRMGFVYGAGSSELLAVREALRLGRPVYAGTHHPAWWINAPDAALAVVAAVEQRQPGLLVTVVEDQPASPQDFLNYFAESQGLVPPAPPPRFAVWAQPTKQQVAVMELHTHISSDDAKEKLGWSPRFPSYQQGIDDMLLSWRAAEAAEIQSDEKAIVEVAG